MDKEKNDRKDTHEGDGALDAREIKIKKEKRPPGTMDCLKSGISDLGVKAGAGFAGYARSYIPDDLKGTEEEQSFRTSLRLSHRVLGVLGARKSAEFYDNRSVAIGSTAKELAEQAEKAGKKHVSARDLSRDETFPGKGLTGNQKKVTKLYAEETAALVSLRRDLLDLAERNPKLFQEKGLAYLKDPDRFFYIKDPEMTRRMAMELLRRSERPEVQRLLRQGLNAGNIDRVLKRKELDPIVRNSLLVLRQSLQKTAAQKVRKKRRAQLAEAAAELIASGGGTGTDGQDGIYQYMGFYAFAASGVRMAMASGHLAATGGKAAGRLLKKIGDKTGASEVLQTAAVRTAVAAGEGMARVKQSAAGQAASHAAKTVKDKVHRDKKNSQDDDAGRDAAKNADTDPMAHVKEKRRGEEEKGKTSPIYDRDAESPGSDGGRKAQIQRRKEERKESSAVRKSTGVIGRAQRRASGVSESFRNLKMYLVLAVLLIILLWVVSVVVFAAVGGTSGEVGLTVTTTMDMTNDDLDGYVSRLISYDSVRQDLAIAKAQEMLETDSSIYTVTGDHTIDAWGHPSNEDPDGNAQEEFDGINIYYVDGSAFDEGNTDETGRPTEDHIISTGYSDVESVIAAAAAMFSNTGIQENTEAFEALLDDLYDIMNPEEDESYVVPTDIYSNAYWNNEEEWTESTSFTYYCNDESSRSAAEEALSEFRESLSGLQEEGAGVYGYEYTVSVTDRDGNTSGSEDGPAVLSFTSEVNDHEQLITTHDVSGISVPIESSEEGCLSYEVTTVTTSDTDTSSDGYTYGDGTTTSTETEIVYYCPGHEVTVDATVDYGRRDVDLYIPVWSIDELFERFTVEEYLPDWESSSYAEFIRDFVENGGWQSEEDDYYYQTICLNFLSRDWEVAYSLDFRNGEDVATSSDSDYLSSADYSDLSGSRAELVSAAYEAVGKICYYYGGKPVSPIYEENDFGSTVDPDPMGRTIRGLDCSGFIDYVAWQVTGENNYMQGMGTAGAPGTEFTDPDDLQPGDLGMYKSRSDSAQGASNHVGIFVGWDDDGTALWIACGSKGVTLQKNSGFIVYYSCPLGE